MKTCPRCEKPIPEDKEICDDPVCKALNDLDSNNLDLIDLELVRKILFDLVEADIVFF